jgi:endonuclease I
MLRYRIFILTTMFITNVLCSNTIKFASVIRNAMVLNNKMPCIYTEKDFKLDDNHIRSMCSMEHIFPRSYLQKSDYSDMHNIVRTINELNVMRSNYKYIDEKDDDKNWIHLTFDNYVNHKNKLFVPNKVSRGFISRSILYMVKEYNYSINKVIDKDVLIKWFYEYPPCAKEKYHNDIVRDLQHKNNMFISCYSKKSKTIHRFLEKL